MANSSTVSKENSKKAEERPIIIKGARTHNLKNVDVIIPRNKLTVVTGVSGSGKSSLAFDTIYAEGQRRYVESLSSYARQFLERMDKPDVDFMQGISPAMPYSKKQVPPIHDLRLGLQPKSMIIFVYSLLELVLPILQYLETCKKRFASNCNQRVI